MTADPLDGSQHLRSDTSVGFAFGTPCLHRSSSLSRRASSRPFPAEACSYLRCRNFVPQRKKVRTLAETTSYLSGKGNPPSSSQATTWESHRPPRYFLDIFGLFRQQHVVVGAPFSALPSPPASAPFFARPHCRGTTEGETLAHGVGPRSSSSPEVDQAPRGLFSRGAVAFPAFQQLITVERSHLRCSKMRKG